MNKAAIALLSAMALSCGSETEVDLVIPQDHLAEVLAELYLASSRAEAESRDPAATRAEVLRLYGLDSSLLDEAILQLTDHPEVAHALYQQTLDRLIGQQRALRAQSIDDD